MAELPDFLQTIVRESAGPKAPQELDAGYLNFVEPDFHVPPANANSRAAPNVSRPRSTGNMAELPAETKPQSDQSSPKERSSGFTANLQVKPERKQTDGQTQIKVLQAWKQPSPGDRSLGEILSAFGARYVWAYHNAFETLYFVENQQCLQYQLLPDTEKRPDEKIEIRTLISKQWVLPEVIDAFNKSFEDHDPAFYSIKGKLPFVCRILQRPLLYLAQMLTPSAHRVSSKSWLRRQPT